LPLRSGIFCYGLIPDLFFTFSTGSKDMLGKTFKIKKEHLKAVKASDQDVRTGSHAFRVAVAMSESTKKNFWELIRELYPETEGYNLSFNSKNMEISVTGGE